MPAAHRDQGTPAHAKGSCFPISHLFYWMLLLAANPPRSVPSREPGTSVPRCPAHVTIAILLAIASVVHGYQWSTVSLASLASLLVALLFLAPNARAQDDGTLLEVAPRGEKVEIGKDFVVELKLNPPRGASIVVGSVAATATADDGVAFFGLAYPLKALTAAAPGGAVFGGQAAFEFVAPVNYDAAPGVYPVTMTVTYQLG